MIIFCRLGFHRWSPVYTDYTHTKQCGCWCRSCGMVVRV